ncbi:DUF481 domain-containing protein [Aquisalimonas asiatica]|uniref:Putative salt-induced outer membrane protein YdiY n=1 Tax=Aquisalimonas asiatica TaxID=406100 RepID=A0A1H8RLU3_9GAMM|nr:DUF481 domain-containing protein [Aquisalimonas asiatica]SEO67326.1 Putative salt-induced outer membrane protein YdiY [Aquisalimonas asiatica]
MHPRHLLLSVTALGLAATHTAMADTITLGNGDRITGSLVEIDGNRVKFQPEASDDPLLLSLDTIARLETDDTIQVLMEDGTEVRGQAVASEEGALRLESDQFDDPITFPIGQITRVTGPDTPVREPIRTTGNISLGARVTDGNTRTQTYSGTADASIRSDVNRIRFNAEFNRTRDRGEDTVDNAAGGVRYDHFVTDAFYLNSNVSLARDRFRDLRLRTTAGVGLGYQFFDTGTRTLSAEAGISYVNEDYYDAENQTNPAGRWALDYEERFAGNGIRLFHAQEGLVNLEDADDTIISTRTGVRFPFIIGMTGTFQINFDYENQPPGDNRKTDTAYVLTAGYSW